VDFFVYIKQKQFPKSALSFDMAVSKCY